jgi:hypothetical protein
MEMMQGDSGDVKAWGRESKGTWIWKIMVVIMEVQSCGEKSC